jgi:hypothetical protein
MAVDKSEIDRIRIQEIVDRVFAGSQRAMAQRVEFSPGLVSRVLAGHVPASGKLLQAIARLPEINGQWLLKGEGEPFQTKPQVLTDIGAVVPVAKQLLSGPPLESEELLSHRFVSVMRAFFSSTAYAIVVASCKCDQELRTREFLKPDDTLIIETSLDSLRDVSRDDSQKLYVMHTSEYGASLAVSESDYYRITEGLPQSKQKMDISITIDGRKGRAIKLDEDDENNLDVPVERGNAQRTRGRKESPVVVGRVTLLMREYLQS